MPGLTGLQFIQSGLAASCMFILITAYEKYALEGYTLDVVDYLVKPVALDRFLKACNKALEFHQLRAKSKSDTQTHQPPVDYFFVNVDYSLLKVQKSDIAWIEGFRDYIKIHLLSTPKPILTRMSIKAIEEQLTGSPFIRIHKSYLVSFLPSPPSGKTAFLSKRWNCRSAKIIAKSFFNAIGKTN